MGALQQFVSGLLTYIPGDPPLFNTLAFMVLFAAFMIVYELVKRRPVARMVVTVAFSLFFYYKCSAECCYILMGICASDYLLGRLLGRLTRVPYRKLVVAANVIIAIGLLGYFKYFNLLARTWADMRAQGFDALDIIVPAGISFFTFRSISYIVDIYRHELEPETNFLRYAFSLTFFPPLLAGPVVRAKDLLPQVKANPVATPQMTGEGLFLIMCGLVKKVIIADYLSGNFVNRVFDNPSLYTGFENIVACVGFTIQLYCDFSGYSDIAIGLALLMGYRFKENFRAPFKAQNPSEFWRRWHISLSTWLRDYIYIPLGGSRKGKWRTYVNNMLTMLLGGLWHGASWMYLLWGAYHGLLLAVHKALKPVWQLPVWLKGHFALRLCNVGITFTLVVIGFAIFRADSPETLVAMYGQITGDLHLSVARQFAESYLMIVLAMGAAVAMHYTPRKWTTGLCETYVGSSVALQSVLLALVVFLVMQAASSELVPFIYLQY